MRGRDRVPRRRPGSEGGHRVQTMGITRSFNLLTGRGPGMARRRAPRTGKVGPGGPRWGRSERIRSMTGLALAFRLCPSPRGPIHHTHGATWRPFLGQPVGGVRRIVTASARCIAVHCSALQLRCTPGPKGGHCAGGEFASRWGPRGAPWGLAAGGRSFPSPGPRSASAAGPAWPPGCSGPARIAAPRTRRPFRRRVMFPPAAASG